MASINLLPTNLAPKGSVIKIAELLKNVISIGIVILLVGLVGALAIVVLNYFQLQNLGGKSDTLKASIASLEQTETKFVLVKDRVEKGKKIIEEAGSKDYVEKLSGLLLSLPTEIKVTSINIEKDKFTITLTSTNSGLIANFMGGIVSDSAYSQIDLKDFSFTPTAGYLVSLDIF